MNDIELKDGERVNQLFSSDVKIIQNREVFSYSIDSVLLSRFPKLPNRGLIVDLCAGNARAPKPPSLEWRYKKD